MNKKISAYSIIFFLCVLLFTVFFLQLHVLKVSKVYSILKSASASGETNIGVYWDSACTRRVISIEWGTLYPGEIVNKIVYVRNEISNTLVIFFETENWEPSNAVYYLSVAWNWPSKFLYRNQVVPIKLTLKVLPNQGITAFSFDIVFSSMLASQLDFDGNLVIDIVDIRKVSSHYDALAGYPMYDLRYDLNEDGVIDTYDLRIVTKYFGETL